MWNKVVISLVIFDTRVFTPHTFIQVERGLHRLKLSCSVALCHYFVAVCQLNRPLFYTREVFFCCVVLVCSFEGLIHSLISGRLRTMSDSNFDYFFPRLSHILYHTLCIAEVYIWLCFFGNWEVKATLVACPIIVTWELSVALYGPVNVMRLHGW